MTIETSKDVEEFVRLLVAAWRDGDADRVEAAMSADPNVVLGNPGPFPPAVGAEAALAVVRMFAPMGRNPDLPKATFEEVLAYASGDSGWAHAEGYLEVAGKGRHRFRNVLVLRREEGAWKWLHWYAFMPAPMALIGTETLGFI